MHGIFGTTHKRILSVLQRFLDWRVLLPRLLAAHKSSANNRLNENSQYSPMIPTAWPAGDLGRRYHVATHPARAREGSGRWEHIQPHEISHPGSSMQFMCKFEGSLVSITENGCT